MFGDEYDFAMIMPEPHVAPKTAQKLLGNNKDFAILIPTDLINEIERAGPEPATSANLEHRKAIQQLVNKASKLVLTGCGHTWLFRMEGQPKMEKVLAVLDNPTPQMMAPLKELIAAQNMKDVEANYPTHQIHVRPDGLIMVQLPNERSKVFVPTGHRKSLIEKTHLELDHLGSAKMIKQLEQSFIWPSLKTDTRKFGTCHECVLSKAKRNLSHGQFSALAPRGPHEHFSVDFHGVTKTQNGNSQILTIVDTFSSYVQFVPCTDRSAETFVMKFMNNVVHKTGMPLQLRSDDAQEFLAHLSNEMMQKLGIKHSTTLGCNPTGNSRCERLHNHLGCCLRILTDDEYHNMENHLNSIAHSWNTTHHATLGCTPFELHHGVKARSDSEAIIARGSKDTAPTVSTALDNVRKHASLFKKAAQKHAASVRTERMQKLNSRSNKNSRFKSGDKVMVYKPPHQNDTLVRKRKAKHMNRFVGPGLITDVLNPAGTAFDIKMTNSGNKFKRTLANVRPYPELEFTPPERDAVPEANGFVSGEAPGLYAHGKIPIGKTVIVLDDENSNAFRLGMVTQNHQEWHKVHLFLTKGKHRGKQLPLQKLQFKLGFHDPNDGMLIWGAHNAKRHKGAKPWTAKLDKNTNLIFAINVSLDKNGRLSHETIAQLPNGCNAIAF
jgi:transposase InsO family protein